MLVFYTHLKVPYASTPEMIIQDLGGQLTLNHI
jgi:hypothetical protein